MDACSLCDSYQNEKYRIIHDDGLVFAMMNNEPLKNGHIMILPVRHAELLSDLTNEEAGAFLKLTERCMKAAEKLGSSASLAVVNSTVHRSQPHFHAHVIPSAMGLRGLLVAAEGVAFRNPAEISTLEERSKEFIAVFE